MKRALILGIGGQDGSYLADLLLEKGYEVHGGYRRSSVDNLARIDHCRDRVALHEFDLTDPLSIARMLDHESGYWFEEIYNMADQDHVGWSFRSPGYSAAVTYGGVAHLLDAVKSYSPASRIYQPVSMTMLRQDTNSMDERTPLEPHSPYACAKAGAYLLCQHYRREHNLGVWTGICWNHDSPRRGPEYLLQKIARGAVAVAKKKAEYLYLYGHSTRVDVGFAGDFARAAWMMLQTARADDYCLCTGVQIEVGALARQALLHVGATLDALRGESGSPGLPAVGSYTKALDAFGWSPVHDAMTTLDIILKGLME